MGFHCGQIYNKIAVYDLRTEVQLYAVPQIHLLRFAIEGIYRFDAITFLQCIISECLKGMRRDILVSGSAHHHAFTDGNVIYSLFLKQDHHVFDNSGGSDNSPLGKICGCGPEYDIRFDKDLCFCRQMIQTMGKLNGLAY